MSHVENQNSSNFENALNANFINPCENTSKLCENTIGLLQ